jgi:hypothetical protein
MCNARNVYPLQPGSIAPRFSPRYPRPFINDIGQWNLKISSSGVMMPILCGLKVRGIVLGLYTIRYVGRTQDQPYIDWTKSPYSSKLKASLAFSLTPTSSSTPIWWLNGPGLPLIILPPKSHICLNVESNPTSRNTFRHLGFFAN